MESLIQHFKSSNRISIKLLSYFEIYDSVLSKFRNKKVTLLEIGVLNGGSLQMWKSFLGDSARIIGADINPQIKKDLGSEFEILIFDQEDPLEWDKVFKKIGKIDILIDDGGHTSLGQIVTCVSSAPFINNGGVIIIEDVHSSYHSNFGTPHKYSFDNWVKKIETHFNEQYYKKSTRSTSLCSEFISRIFCIMRFRSLTIFEIKNHLTSQEVLQNRAGNNTQSDYRYHNKSKYFNFLYKVVNISKQNSFVQNRLVDSIIRKVISLLFGEQILKMSLKKDLNKGKRYFDF